MTDPPRRAPATRRRPGYTGVQEVSGKCEMASDPAGGDIAPQKWISCAVRPGPTGYCSVKRLLGPGRRVILMAEGDPDEGGYDACARLVTGAGRNAGIPDAEDGSDGQRS